MLLCFAGYCFALAYGMTFLLPLLMETQGANEAVAGNIISSASVTSVIAALLSGHFSDSFGTCRAAMIAGGCLAASVLGFALIPNVRSAYLLALLFGTGWGAFYVLGPILAARILTGERRDHGFALLAGFMMSGIGTGPIIGGATLSAGAPVSSAFLLAGAVVALGVLSLGVLGRRMGAQEVSAGTGDRLSWASLRAVMRSTAAQPIFMVGVAGAVFGGLSSFQTSYAASHGFAFIDYFAGFTIAAIFARLFLAPYALRSPQPLMNLLLTAVMAIAVGLFILIEDSTTFYVFSSALFGASYGLHYSLLNSQATRAAPEKLVPQSLVLFSLSYFIGALGMPKIAGWIVTTLGTEALSYGLFFVAVLNFSVALFGIAVRKRASIVR